MIIYLAGKTNDATKYGATAYGGDWESGQKSYYN